MNFIEDYKNHTKQRQLEGITPLALNTKQTASLIELLKEENIKESEYLLNLFENKINPGVDDSAYIKASFLNDIVQEKTKSKVINKEKAIELLGTMIGGFNVNPLIEALKLDNELASLASKQLQKLLYVYDSFNDIKELMDNGNKYAKEVISSWANALWFTQAEDLEKEITLTVLKIDGETNTDDLSPAQDAFTRSDIPLHANAFLKTRIDNPLETIKKLKEKGHSLVYVGDVVGTGSSRKSGINSIQWHMGDDIDYIPNKRTKGIVIGQTIAPIFYNTAQDSGALPIEADVDNLNTGDIITIKPYDGEIIKDGKVISTFNLSPNTITDEYKAGGRIPLIIGRNLCYKARETLNMPKEDIFKKPSSKSSSSKGYTQAQKIIGKACGLKGVRAGDYVEPTASTVGSQDTTGPMTRDEIKELSALSFGADMVMQSFCHTAAYPKPSDVDLQHTLPDFISTRGGVALKSGDGVIHSWLNRLCLPDTLGTGGDSHTRFPIGISFPAGSGLVAFAAVSGTMPLNVPESVLIRFSGELQKGITLRDVVNAIPYYAIKQGLLTVDKNNKKNIFAGKIIEIEGLPNLKVEQAFELSDASAERSSSGCSVALNKEVIIEYLSSNIKLIEQMIKNGYQDTKTLQRRADKMQEWIKNPTLFEADKDAEYEEIIEINLNDIIEPILACPNDPDDVATLSEILADDKRPTNIDEVFVGSCMTNIGHYRALGNILKDEGQTPTKLWIAPPTKMDKSQLVSEGYYSIFGASSARIEIPGCSLCMGNQARVKDGAVVFSTSTRNFNNRMGKDAQVYLGSAELAGVCATLGRLPKVNEYMDLVDKKIKDDDKKDIYKYLNFHQVNDESLGELLK